MKPDMPRGAQPTATPIHPDVLAAESARLNARPWAEVRANYAGQPTNDGEAAGGAGGEGGPGGEGAQATDQQQAAGPFAAVLEAAGDSREAVEAALKSTQAKITKAQQQAADFRSQWEPFGELGLAEVGPEGVAQALTLARLFSDPSKASDLVSDPAAFEQTWEAIGDALGYFEPDEGGGQQVATPAEGDEPPAWAKPLIDDYAQRQEEREQRAAEDLARESDGRVQEQLDELEQNPDYDKAKDEPEVLLIAQGLAFQGETNAISKAWEHLQRIRGGAERELVEGKERQPDPAEPGGQAHTEPEKVTDFKQARQIVERVMAAS